MAELQGVALVTGASTGIGRHLAEGLAARGMAVAGMARGEERLTTAMRSEGTSTRLVVTPTMPPVWLTVW